VQALLAQFDRVGLAPSEDTWPSRTTAPRTLTEACEAAIQAEIDSVAMYERLIAQISDPVLRQVMRRLEEASRERHLPAFKRCLSLAVPRHGGAGRP
jgi:rubrerythrin